MKLKKPILQSNCSEESFKLSGSLSQIKSEVKKMLKVWGNDRDDESKKWSEYTKNTVAEQTSIIEATTSLKDFEAIVWSFTCNYETFFREINGELHVATCNNHPWDDGNINSSPSEFEYYDLRDRDSYYLRMYSPSGNDKDNEIVIEQKVGDAVLILKLNEHTDYNTIKEHFGDLSKYQLYQEPSIKVSFDPHLHFGIIQALYKNEDNLDNLSFGFVVMSSDTVKLNKVKILLKLQNKEKM